MKRTVLSLAFLVACLSGCTVYQINSKDTTKGFYPPKKSIDEVRYMEKVDQPFEEIGIVTVTTERIHSIDDVLPLLKQEAAILGGDVITDVKEDTGGAWKNAKLQKLLGNSNIRTSYTAKVLVFTKTS